MAANSPTIDSRAARRRWLAIAALVLATLAVYSNSLRGPFVYDDIPAVPGNPTIRHLWPLTDVLRPQAEGGLTVSGRPVLNLSLAWNHAISGEAVWSYHAFNLLMHVASALLLFGIARRTLLRRGYEEQALVPQSVGSGQGLAGPPASEEGRAPRLGDPATGLALAIAALWALHPLQTQAISYVVQRAESLMGFFYLLALYAFVRATECHPLGDARFPDTMTDGPPVCHLLDDKRVARRRVTWLGISIGACALGMGTKEVMATAPLMVLLYDRTFVAGSFGGAWRERRGFFLGLAATWILLAALVLSTGGNRGGTVGVGVAVPWWAYGLTQFRAVCHYLRLSFWPSPLVFEYGTAWAQSAADVLPYAVIVLLLIAATGLALWRRPGGTKQAGAFGKIPGKSAWGFLGAWFFGILAPSSLTPGTIQMIVEHRMYLPLAAVVAAVVLAAHAWLGRRFWPLCAIAAIGLGGLTVARNRDYRSHLALWTDTVAKRPDNPRAHEGLAEAFTELNRLDEAIAEQTEATRLKPDEPTYHYNVALLLARAGRTDEAIRRYEISLRLKPDEPHAQNNLAVALVQAGRLAEALPHYAEAERLAPDDAQFHYNHGIALSRLGRDAEAVAHFEAALRGRPDFADAHFNLAIGFGRLGRLPEARREFEAVVRLKPDDAEARRYLEQVRAALGGARN